MKLVTKRYGGIPCATRNLLAVALVSSKLLLSPVVCMEDTWTFSFSSLILVLQQQAMGRLQQSAINKSNRKDVVGTVPSLWLISPSNLQQTLTNITQRVVSMGLPASIGLHNWSLFFSFYETTRDETTRDEQSVTNNHMAVNGQTQFSKHFLLNCVFYSKWDSEQNQYLGRDQ